MTPKQFYKRALAFPGTEANPHFDRVAFKVTGKRIFATLQEESLTANLMLSPLDQSVFINLGKGSIYPVPNKWGLKGVTTFSLKTVSEELLVDALETAYHDVLKATKKPNRRSSI